MALIELLPTNTVSTLDWLNASKDISFSAYDPGSFVQETQVRSTQIDASVQKTKGDPIFGTHIRETAETVKRWFDK